MVVKISDDIFSRFATDQSVTDGQTDRMPQYTNTCTVYCIWTQYVARKKGLQVTPVNLQ